MVNVLVNIRPAYLFFALFLALAAGSCKKPVAVVEAEEEEPTDTLAVYMPNEFSDMDFNDDASTWSHQRSRHSTHFVVFWGKGYGTHDPGSASVETAYRVDIDDLLEKAEAFYALNIDTLKFAERGVGQSKLDQYKMMIFLHYTTDWMAYGGGYDDVIGALWISPNTAQPVGATIAHEIGHSFQYQVRCDLGSAHGFRYGFGGNGGNGFWEQTAQWQAHQSYPLENFESHHFSVYAENYHRHQFHEWYRYANYFIHHYWVDKYGLDIVGRVWREAVQPEDPIQAYKRITGISDVQFNEEIYDMATKYATWDIDPLRSLGSDYIGALTYKFTVLGDGSLCVTYERAPGTTGYNIIPLEVPAAGTVVSIDFTGLTAEPGFNPIADPARAGWRYGYVALLQNGTRVYGDMHSGATGMASFTVPVGCDRLFFVVTGAPTSYAPHAWDEDEANDEQWPYQIKVTNTEVIGYLTFDDDEPRDTTFTFNVSFPRDTVNYSGTTVAVDQSALARAFVLQPSQITDMLGDEITFYAVESDGGLNAMTTANGYGHWFDSVGDVIAWGAGARVFSEFNESTQVFTIGQYPGQATTNHTYIINQALVYEYEPGQTVQATFVFHITLE
ncbi:hypothetical protein GCM10007415_04970 [Parapedobacter pyrenivorans]|uniref:DUF4859 domain-containing protein n=1 Tax=Parapedobacter pyrenivorans TaxID=1305674 RepID=A0A917HDG1_9SPHI|nr:DUF4859 domain-containing protein [Parapedobacter pyrenivorans]GGG76221.1 hypothetical protein GCM10007415_04970 [Parapedobacter pyrenivorans]